MNSPELSFYERVKDVQSQKVNTLADYLNKIKNGVWQDKIFSLRGEKDPKKQDEIKKTMPGCTISGTFQHRKIDGLKQHSGFIAIDIDKRDPNEVKALLYNDPYVYSMFTSCRGQGVCVIVKINGAKHDASFSSICEYFFTTYKIIVDTSGRDPSRYRIVSFDPDLYLNEGSSKFTKVQEYKEPKRIQKVVFVQDDFSQIVKDIVDRRINICDNYHEWIRVGFGLADKFGEGGLEYFHLVSQISDKYSPQDCDRQYAACMRAKGSKLATIGTFYHYAKENGIQIYSEKTKNVINSVVSQRKAGVKKIESILDTLQTAGLGGSEAIVEQVISNDIQETIDSNLIDDVILYIESKYDLRRNEITRFIEDGAEVLEQREMNSLFLDVKRKFDKISYEVFERILNSKNTREYNPFQDFINENIDRGRTGAIDNLFMLIQTDDPEYLRYFGKKWLVGIISSIYGEHSPLMLVLCSKETGTGKTEFFRRLLPKDLKKYYAESKLDRGKDDEILMTQKLIIMDDEMGGKSKKDTTKIKNLTSTQTFSLREPYGRNNVDLNRIATLCGTSNEEEIIIGEDDNRRIIPVRVKSVDWRSVEKLSVAVFMEAYNLYNEGFDWRISAKDKLYLQGDKSDFERHTDEYEMIVKLFRHPLEGEEPEYLTGSEILTYVQNRTSVKYSSVNIGKALSKAKFIRFSKKVNGNPIKVYSVIKEKQTEHDALQRF